MVSTLVVVLSSARDPWCSIENLGQRETWARVLPPGIQVLWVRGKRVSEQTWDRQSRTLMVRNHLRLTHRVALLRDRPMPTTPAVLDSANNVLEVDVPETLDWMGHRLIGTLSHALEFTDFDFVLRTNSSSYIDPNALQSWICSRSTVPDYFGVPILVKRGPLRLTYASGTTIGMSRSAVQRVVGTASSWRHDFIEDLALGVKMRELGIPLQPIRRVDVTSASEVAHLSRGATEDVFAYRCKVEQNPIDAVAVMHALAKRLG